MGRGGPRPAPDSLQSAFDVAQVKRSASGRPRRRRFGLWKCCVEVPVDGVDLRGGERAAVLDPLHRLFRPEAMQRERTVHAARGSVPSATSGSPVWAGYKQTKLGLPILEGWLLPV